MSTDPPTPIDEPVADVDDEAVPAPDDGPDDQDPPEWTEEIAPETAEAARREAGLPEPAPEGGPTFAGLGLTDALVEAVAQAGFKVPTPIQAEAIPPLLAGRDVLGLAATGTGKTAAFVLPLVQNLAGTEHIGAPRAIVLVPTRELAIQVARATTGFARAHGLRTVPVFGGAPYPPQVRALQRGADVVVGTPGRVKDLLERGILDLSGIEYSVLDEADEMLDMGFQEDLEIILGSAPEDRQVALFSATFPSRLRRIANKSLKDPLKIEVERGTRDDGAPLIRQHFYAVNRQDVPAALVRLLEVENPSGALVFCHTREQVEGLANAVARHGVPVEALHGGFAQQHRERVMDRLRAGDLRVVVATDVAARGVDVAHLSHVINVGLPDTPEQYVHRIGRTGRAGREGCALTLAWSIGKARRRIFFLQKLLGHEFELESLPGPEVVQELRTRRLVEQLYSIISDVDLEAQRALVEALTDDVDPLDLAAAALHALDAEKGLGDLAPIDDPLQHRSRKNQRQPHRGQAPRPHRGQHDGGGHRGGHRGGHGGGGGGEWRRLYVGLGRRAGMRPGDLFGAILGESGVPRGAIGNIRVNDRYTLVEVAGDAADQVIRTMRNASWRGRKLGIRYDSRD